jgi:metal-sulfur cluster biosynthetic enzyme
MTEDELLSLLRDCYEPGAPRRNIVAAGLLRSVSLSRDDEIPGAGIPGVPPRFHAHISLLLPGMDDTANAQLAAQIENRLLGVAAISRVTIELLPALFPIL